MAELRQLRILDTSFIEVLHEAVMANQEHLRPWLPFASEPTYEGTLGFLKSCEMQVARNNGYQSAILIDDVFAGVIGLHAVNWINRSTAIGYWLSKEFEGRGVMTGAVCDVLDHCFSELKLHRVEICAAEANFRSRAIPERLGFQFEGIRREAEILNERWVNHAVYSLLDYEWTRPPQAI